MRRRFPGPSLQALVVLLAGVAIPGALHAQSEVRSLDGAEPPRASIEDVAWIAGSWTGSGFGGTFTEVWTSPEAGSMVGLYKHVSDGHVGEGTVNFYEIQLIVEDEGTLIWKVKHFSPDFVGWEEKDGYESFPLVELTEEAAYFDGLTIRRDGPDAMTVWLRVRSGDDIREERLDYRRTPLLVSTQ